MNKIGLCIKITSQGAGEANKFNAEGNWAQRVVDVREMLKNVVCQPDHFIRFMSFCETGCLVTIVRRISGRDGDNVAAWIHIPNNLVITGEDVCQVIDGVEELLKKSMVTAEEWTQLVGREYSAKRYAIAITPSPADGGLAGRTVGYYSLAEILGEGRYQSYYNPYKYIFLFDQFVSPAPAARIDDLTRNGFEQGCIYVNPSESEIRAKFGSSAFLCYQLGNEKPVKFTHPIRVPKDTTITLLAFKSPTSNYEPERFFDKVTKEEQTCSLDNAAGFNGWKMKVTRRMFDITDKNGNPLPGANIVINNEKVDEMLMVPEASASNAHITISAEGYDKVSTKANLNQLSESNQAKVKLEKSKTSIKYAVLLINGERGELTVESKSLNRHIVPLEGYAFQTREDGSRDESIIKFNESKRIAMLAASFVAGALIVGLVWLAMTIFFPGEEKEKPVDNPSEGRQTEKVDETTGTGEEEEHGDAPQVPDYTAAQEYIDNNNFWKKADMDKIEGLENLFDNVNTGKLDLISDYQKDFLRKSTNPNANELINKIEDRSTWTPEINSRGFGSDGINLAGFNRSCFRRVEAPKPAQQPAVIKGGMTEQGGNGDANPPQGQQVEGSKGKVKERP